MTRVDRAKELRAAAGLAAQGATDAQAAAMPTMYDLWAPGVAYGGEGQPSIVRRPDGQLYRIRQAHTSQVGWEPETTFEVGIKKTIKWYLEHQEWMERCISGDYQKYYEDMYKNR